ncbi:MAG: alpha amylase C-terminal domain-containing protein, partial [Desulfobulbaceae bacterium]|nr:alpha amylase C-terminal domain-containing protein [Desulfobulbaceae bacterium]
WKMGWMHDTLRYMSKEPIHRKHHHHDMTFGMHYAYHENYVLPLSHDEVVHGKGALLNKMSGDEWQKFANLRAYFGFMWAYPGKKLLFMGCEFGQWQEWNFEKSLEWEALTAPNHHGVQRLVRDLNIVYQAEPALHEVDFDPEGFAWIDANDTDNSIFSFIRKARSNEHCIIIICNFTPVVRRHYRIGVPASGSYKEIINSDMDIYGGSGVTNPETMVTEDIPFHGHSCSLSLTLPPLVTIMLKAVDLRLKTED